MFFHCFSRESCGIGRLCTYGCCYTIIKTFYEVNEVVALFFFSVLFAPQFVFAHKEYVYAPVYTNLLDLAAAPESVGLGSGSISATQIVQILGRNRIADEQNRLNRGIFRGHAPTEFLPSTKDSSTLIETYTILEPASSVPGKHLSRVLYRWSHVKPMRLDPQLPSRWPISDETHQPHFFCRSFESIFFARC